MFEYIKYFFNPAHVLTINPPLMHQRAIIILAIIFGTLIIIGLLSKFVSGKQDALKAKGLRRLYYMGLTMGIIGYFYLFFAWQGAVLLSGRFWLLLWFATTVLWAGFIIKYLLVDAPAKRKAINQRRQFEQYLP